MSTPLRPQRMDDEAPSSRRARVLRGCLLSGPVIGVWAVVPPYFGPKLNVTGRVEVADHVVPGIVVLVATLVTVMGLRRAQGSVVASVSGLVVLLAGIWMVATHVALVRQAVHHVAPSGAVAFHAVPGLAVVALGLLWSVMAWSTSSAA